MFYDLVNVYVFVIGSICIHGKEFRKFTFHHKHRESAEKNSPSNQLSLVNDDEVISLSHAKVYIFSDSVLCLGKVNQNPTSNIVWEQQLDWFKSSSEY